MNANHSDIIALAVDFDTAKAIDPAKGRWLVRAILGSNTRQPIVYAQNFTRAGAALDLKRLAAHYGLDVFECRSVRGTLTPFAIRRYPPQPLPMYAEENGHIIEGVVECAA